MPPKKRSSKKKIGYRPKKGRPKPRVQEYVHAHDSDTDSYADFFDTFLSSSDGNTSDEVLDYEGSSANEFFLIADRVIQVSPMEDTDRLYLERTAERQSQRYQSLLGLLRLEAAEIYKETGFVMLNSEAIRFVQVYDIDNPGIKFSVSIEPVSFCARIFIHRKMLRKDHPVNQSCYCVSDVRELLASIAGYGICIGNPDKEFQSLRPGTNGFREFGLGAVRGNFYYEETILHKECELLSTSLRCQKCVEHRSAMRKRKSVENKKTLDEKNDNLFSKRTPHSKMSPKQMSAKVTSLQKERRAMSSEIKSLRKKLQQAIEQSSKMSDNTNADMCKIVADCGEEVKKEFPDENSFQRLFWDEQKKYNECKTPSAMKWHPMIIKWCLQMKGRSTKCYETLRDIGFIKLPSSRTLYNYSHFMDSTCGVSPEIVSHLISECRAKGIFKEEWRSYVGLLQDEIKVKEDLVYDKHSGELIGFTNLDTTNNEFSNLENCVTGQRAPLARHMLVVMVRGIASDLKYPLACYATDGITAETLYPIIYKCIRVCEVHVGLRVMFVTCDGASQNRKFFAMHGTETTYSTTNPYAPDRQLYFISDVPHLVKTCRNCFADSDSHSKTRHLWNNKSISWMHIVDLYNNHVHAELFTHCPKLTKQHINLDAHSKMNVSLAAQIFSKTVAHALEHLCGDNVSETVVFIRMMDKFFDCLNTRHLGEGKRKRNPNVEPYTSPNDERLFWLQNDFLKYFEDWKEMAENRAGDFNKDDRARMQLSRQSLQGLQISVNAIVELVRYLLSHGVPFVLTSVFNQDPLEQQFGHCRHLGGSQQNPRVYDVRHSLNRLRVMGSTVMALTGGNTKRHADKREIDNTSLPKRSKQIPRI